MLNDAIYDENGKVVIVYYQPIPKYIKTPTSEILFNCQFGISLAFVNENEVQSLLDYRGGCCGNKQQVMFLANAAQYAHWKDGQGGR